MPSVSLGNGARSSRGEGELRRRGVPRRLLLLEPLTCLALAGHALAVHQVSGEPAMAASTGGAALLVVLAVAGLCGMRAPWAVVTRAGVILVLAFILMAVNAPGSGYFLLWFFVLIAVYPLVLPRRPSRVLVAAVPAAYVLLVPFGATDGPLPVVALRAVSLLLIGVFVDIAATAYQVAADARDQALALLDTYVAATPVGLGFWDLALRCRQVNAALAELTGLRVADHLGHEVEKIPGVPSALTVNLHRVLSTGQPVRDVELVVGERVWASSYYPVRIGPELVGVGGVVIEVSEQRRAAKALSYSATHDSVTGLPNRALFTDRLGVALSQAARGGEVLAVLFCDIDRFKVINDSLGHAVGDELLRIAADRLAGVVRAGDTVARLGGDEFGLLCTGVGDVLEAHQVADRVCAVLREPMRLGERLITSTASVGVTVCAPGDRDVHGLLRDADVAMYQAKDAGRDQVAVFDARLRRTAGERLEFQSSLRRAIERGQITVAYQPVLPLAWGAGADVQQRADGVVGLEALARWNRPGHGDVPPSVFIATAEELGLIQALGEDVLRTACAAVRRWRAGTGRPLTVAVNLSARQLAAPGFVDLVARVLTEVDLAASALQLEITESVLMADIEHSVRRLSELRDLGVSLAIDDFGTGYSSLAYLRDLPVDVLKIDRSFTSRLPGDAAMFSFIVELARAIGATTVVEGVETRIQLDAVSKAGCDRAQGFYLSRPLSESAATSYLTSLGGRA